MRAIKSVKPVATEASDPCTTTAATNAAQRPGHIFPVIKRFDPSFTPPQKRWVFAHEGDTKMRARTTLLVTAVTLAASGAGAGGAAAVPGPTPVNGLTGACNMTNTHAAFGMFEIAGSHANANGFEGGMITAILNTNGGTVPDNCGG